VPSEFIAHILDLLAPLGEVKARAMFGGHGVYLDGKMFALIADDTFYVKVDDVSRPEFESHGLAPFSYDARGKVHTLSYYEPPAAALDDSAELCAWARHGLDAARRKK
jgi:DNA transformation protein